MAKARKKAADKPVFASLRKFQTGTRLFPKYEFPFDVLDKTPGGANLGRIEWHVELHPRAKRRGEKRRRLGEVWVWAAQTRDPRYLGKTFKLETFAESLTTESITTNRAFQPWRIGFCEQHRGAVILEAYPKDHHTRLIVQNSSSISFEVRFE